MGKHFDRIDIVYIVLISIYLVVLFVGILWVILTKLEKKMTKVEIQDLKNNKDIIKPQSKKLTNNDNIKNKTIISAPKKGNNNSKKKTNVGKKAPISKNKVTVKNTNKIEINSSNRSNGYVSPTKRKNTKKKKSSTKKRSSK